MFDAGASFQHELIEGTYKFGAHTEEIIKPVNCISA